MTMKKKSPLRDKSYAFAIEIVRIVRYLREEKKEYVLSKQLLGSGTAIGALTMEAEYAQSKADFINKLNIALKEGNETLYWLRLLHDTDYLSHEQFEDLFQHCNELVSMLVSSIKTLKSSN